MPRKYVLVKSLKNTLRYSYPTSITNNVNSPREFYYISCAQAFNERENRLLLVQPKTNFQAAAFKRPSERDVERKESSKSFGCAWVTAEFGFHTDWWKRGQQTSVSKSSQIMLIFSKCSSSWEISLNLVSPFNVIVCKQSKTLAKQDY